MKNLFIMLSMALMSSTALACQCQMMTEDLAQEMLDDNDAVVLAKAGQDSRAVYNINPDEGMMEDNVVNSTRFSILKDYKNTNFKSINIESPLDMGANCGINFKKDQVVIIGAIKSASDGTLFTTSCGTIDLADSASYDLMIRLDQISKISK